MNLEHNADRADLGMMKHVHQHEDDKLHRRVVVVVKQHFIERGLLELPLGLGFHRFFMLWSVYRHKTMAILSYSERLQEFDAFHLEAAPCGCRGGGRPPIERIPLLRLVGGYRI